MVGREKINANPGDYVKVRLSKFREIEGRILESHDKDVLLLKLNSGYNIGLEYEKIDSVKVLRKFREEKEVKAIEKLSGKGKPKIGLVVTGGTIASKLDSRTGGVRALTSVDEFAKFYPNLFEKVDVAQIEVPFMVDSGSIGPEQWIEMARVIEKMLNNSDLAGVIVTHGTDSLHYSSSALSFMLRNLNKPVVLTYSQRSIDRGSSDAEMNLDCAVNMALSDVAEVMIVGHANVNDAYCYAFPGCKVRKMHTSRRDAFKGINSLPLAKVWADGKVEKLREYRPRNKEKVELDISWSEKVALIKFYPGQKPDILDYYKEKGYKGIVIEFLGLGQIAGSEVKNNWLPKIKKLVNSGVVICGSAQTIYGRLDANVYSSGREFKEAGVIFLEDMLSETAYVKLSWVLGQGRKSVSWVKEKMLENISGEFNEVLGLRGFEG